MRRFWGTNGLLLTWHYMGTTRMHDSPKQGVVDRHCRIHGMSNPTPRRVARDPASGHVSRV